MPIYEYETLNPDESCEKCVNSFEIIQAIDEKPIAVCPYCGQKVRKIISRCHAAIVETLDEHVSIQNKISEHEKQGMWSHAAELADKQSERIRDNGMKIRALENYKKAGYNTNSLEKHVKIKNGPKEDR